jgi:hypothetical protein
VIKTTGAQLIPKRGASPQGGQLLAVATHLLLVVKARPPSEVAADLSSVKEIPARPPTSACQTHRGCRKTAKGGEKKESSVQVSVKNIFTTRTLRSSPRQCIIMSGACTPSDGFV